MLSENQKEIQNLIESRLSGIEKEDAFLYHVSVERKLASVDLWFQSVESITPNIIQYGTASSADDKSGIDIDSSLIKISAFIDAFFMSAKSSTDCFAHEVRGLYGFIGPNDDLYFENMLDLLRTQHSASAITVYLSRLDIKNCDWFKDLKSYRRASAHESIIPLVPSINLDYFTGKWNAVLLKLPLDPTQRPLQYNGKNFIDTGKAIRDNLFDIIIKSYDNIYEDIKNNKTKIACLA